MPATAYTSDLWMVQLAVGYLLGRIVVAALLLPDYFRGELATAYALLERRFGVTARRYASLVFLVTRTLASSVRLFAIAIPIQLIIGLPYWQAIVVTEALTLTYTYFGGLRAVVYVDVLQMCIYLSGAVIALVMLIRLVPGGWSGIMEVAGPAGKLSVVHLTGGFSDGRWLLTGLLGGAFLSMASHGADHLIVQRMLAAPSLRDARKALIGSGVFIVAQFTLFQLVGVALFAYYQERAFATPDEIFPTFIVEALPAGLSGILVAGILSVSMSSEGSAINALASAATLDLYGPLSGRSGESEHMLRAGKAATLFFGALLIGGGDPLPVRRARHPGRGGRAQHRVVHLWGATGRLPARGDVQACGSDRLDHRHNHGHGGYDRAVGGAAVRRDREAGRRAVVLADRLGPHRGDRRAQLATAAGAQRSGVMPRFPKTGTRIALRRSRRREKGREAGAHTGLRRGGSAAAASSAAGSAGA